MNQGFSLTDVLVSLLLITSTSLALLKQQWQVSQFVNQLQTRVNALSALDNGVERLYGAQAAVSMERLTRRVLVQ